MNQAVIKFEVHNCLRRIKSKSVENVAKKESLFYFYKTFEKAINLYFLHFQITFALDFPKIMVIFKFNKIFKIDHFLVMAHCHYNAEKILNLNDPFF